MCQPHKSRFLSTIFDNCDLEDTRNYDNFIAADGIPKAYRPIRIYRGPIQRGIKPCHVCGFKNDSNSTGAVCFKCLRTMSANAFNSKPLFVDEDEIPQRIEKKRKKRISENGSR